MMQQWLEDMEKRILIKTSATRAVIRELDKDVNLMLL